MPLLLATLPARTSYRSSRLPSRALPRINAVELAGKDTMKLFVFGTPGTSQVNLVALLDNLGKGASGAAVQNMDLMLSA